MVLLSLCTDDWDVHFGQSSSEPLQLPATEANSLRPQKREQNVDVPGTTPPNYRKLLNPGSSSSCEFVLPASCNSQGKTKAKLKVLITKNW